MPKTEKATIRLVQRISRKNKNGEYPIYLVVCYQGRVEKSCGVSCLEKYWDKTFQCVKKSCPNYEVLNERLNSIKEKAVERLKALEATNTSYTAKTVLESSTVHVKNDIYANLSECIVAERRLRNATAVRYTYATTKLSQFFNKKDFKISELTVGKLKDFCTFLSKEGISDASIRSILSIVASVYNYALDNGIITSPNPFRVIKYRQKFREKTRDYFLDKTHIVKLKEYFLNLVVERKGSRWTYKPKAFERLHNRQSREFALLWFLMCYKLNGSAPADVALLKKKNVERIQIDGEDYYHLEFKRIKTNAQVSCVIKRDMFTIITLEHFLGETSGEYVYPIICSSADADEKTVKDCIHRLSGRVRPRLRTICEEINKQTIESNAVNDLKEPLIDVNKVVLYTARHTLANHLLDNPTVSIRELASILARSSNSIATYIHGLQKNEEIARITNMLDV